MVQACCFLWYSGFLHQYNWLPRYNWNIVNPSPKLWKSQKHVLFSKPHLYEANVKGRYSKQRTICIYYIDFAYRYPSIFWIFGLCVSFSERTINIPNPLSGCVSNINHHKIFSKDVMILSITHIVKLIDSIVAYVALTHNYLLAKSQFY